MNIRDASLLYPRAVHRHLLADLQLYPVVALMGARQVGKTTLCLQLAGDLGLVRRTLDDRDVREEAQSDPEGFLAGLGDAGAFIDEVQRAPDLILAIKAVVDRDPRKGQYLLTGSNQPKVGQSVSDSLLGRATYRTLRPLTLSELRFDEEHPGWSFLFDDDETHVLAELERRAASSGPLAWQDVVRTGGFPRAVSAPANQRLRILDDYVEIFARRDVQEILSVGSTPRLEAFVRLVATRTGQELNVSDLSRDLGVPVTTLRRWLDALQRSYLVELVPAYSRNAGQRIIKSPKIYSVDAALALAASRDTTPTGFHLETLVAGDLLVWRDGDPTRDLYHWRLSSGPEIDFILEERGELLPVEVKASSGVGAEDARHLAMFRERYGNARRGVLVSCDPGIRVLRSGIVACPWWAVV
jgi:predicted AAA+ superfamily ATPase